MDIQSQPQRLVVSGQLRDRPYRSRNSDSCSSPEVKRAFLLPTRIILSGCPIDYPTLLTGLHWAPIGSARYKQKLDNWSKHRKRPEKPDTDRCSPPGNVRISRISDCRLKKPPNPNFGIQFNGFGLQFTVGEVLTFRFQVQSTWASLSERGDPPGIR